MANIMALTMQFAPQIAHCALMTTVSAVHSLATSESKTFYLMDNNISLVECLALPPIQKKVSAIDAVEIEEVDFDMTGNETIASHEDQTEEAMDMDVFQQRSL